MPEYYQPDGLAGLSGQPEEETYTTGAFARLAKTTPRTLRFYDVRGLLKPSFCSDKGYRLYTRQDLEQLQKILLLKKLGLSLEEISYLLLDGRHDLASSLQLQQTLVLEKLDHLHRIADTLALALRQLDSGADPSDLTGQLIDLIAQDDQLAEQYKNARNLQSRIRLHSQYSTSPINWFDWIWKQMDLHQDVQVLELGCGNGRLWEGRTAWLEEHRIHLTLSDLSEGMIREVRQHFEGSCLSFLVCSAEQIPFRNACFDAAVANHMLFYLSDLEAGLSEITRVLQPDGVLYASAYGRSHMKEIRDLVQEFDPEIVLSATPLYEKFGLENGRMLLEPWFEEVELRIFEDSLEVDSVQDLADYILSCHGNQTERLIVCYPAFESFLEKKIRQNGCIRIMKEAGLFICRIPCRN